ncbi:hypothetical protein AVEN_138851-1 [Araneus ventricosus]|uniref:Uncharacterized protein n=1 Tax=Araneus ventricosus TaxID=182803 RepID=A0A4Y2G8Z4_ARAVE|nr:hypothetical protein AVEN_138851-1 [Araneus ventricosus]
MFLGRFQEPPIVDRVPRQSTGIWGPHTPDITNIHLPSILWAGGPHSSWTYPPFGGAEDYSRIIVVIIIINTGKEPFDALTHCLATDSKRLRGLRMRRVVLFSLK